MNLLERLMELKENLMFRQLMTKGCGQDADDHQVEEVPPVTCGKELSAPLSQRPRASANPQAL